MDPVQILENGFVQRYKYLYTCTKYEDSQIQQFYDGATVLITGGTGFMGKHLLEKLLRSTNVSKIFFLIRPKKGQFVNDRLNEMLKDPLYDLLREKVPQFEQKLVPIEGDVAELRLGMSDGDWNSVIQQTEIIFHVAATTRFDETLRVATLTNIRGTRETLILGIQCIKLRAFVHVSTAYTHARTDTANNNILEEFYRSPVDPEALIKLVETIEEERLNDIAQSIIKGWPNIYSFTKAVSEELVRIKGRTLPLCVIRPAIVISAYREPRPGWLDLSCVYGATGLLMAGYLGMAHVFYIDPEITLAFVPVDFVNNVIIAAGLETAKKSDGEIKIYNVTTSTRNGMPYEKMQQFFDDAAHEYPTPRSVSCYLVHLISNPAIFFMCSWIFHIIPAYIIDGICLFMGKKRIASKMALKLYRLTKALSYYAFNTCNFEDKNVAALYENLSPIDKQFFNFDVTDLDWKDYLIIFGIGIRKYIVKDGLSGTEYGRKKQIVFRILMPFIFFLYSYMLYKVIYLSLFSLVKIFYVFKEIYENDR